MPPLMVIILLHYHCSVSKFGNEGYPDAPAVLEFKARLVRLGAMRPLGPDESSHGEDYAVTDKGRAWVEKICAAPEPVQRIIWE